MSELNEKKREIDISEKVSKRKTRKVTKKVKVTTSPELMSILGKVFSISHSYRQPDVVRILVITTPASRSNRF
jgi:hypothetical protein